MKQQKEFTAREIEDLLDDSIRGLNRKVFVFECPNCRKEMSSLYIDQISNQARIHLQSCKR